MLAAAFAICMLLRFTNLGKPAAETVAVPTGPDWEI
jgi:hypothetical protein